MTGVTWLCSVPALCLAAHAASFTIEFSGLAQPGTEVSAIEEIYAAEDYRLATSTGVFVFWQTDNLDHFGKTALFPSTLDSSISLSRADGRAFDLLGIEFAPVSEFLPDAQSLVIHATRTDGTTNVVTFVVPAEGKFFPWKASGFTSVLDVRWDTADAYVQFANIQVISQENAVVPEPATLPGVMVALLTLAAVFFKRCRS